MLLIWYPKYDNLMPIHYYYGSPIIKNWHNSIMTFKLPRTIGLLMVTALAISITQTALAAEITTTLNLVDKTGIGTALGTVTATDTDYGLLLQPDFTNLPPGVHGFHLHANPSCDPGEKDGEIAPAIAAGGHFDPGATESHQGPYGEGHLGDLPVLIVDEEGTADLPLLAPRLQVADLSGHALIIHEGKDNYADEPKSLGGGGGRLACGVFD